MRNEKLGALARHLVYQFGPDYGTHYLFPLTYFVSATEDPLIQQIESRGLSQEQVQSNLREILSEDPHLRKCCGDVWHLARALDHLFFRRLSTLHFTINDPLPDTQADYVDGALHELDVQLYEQGPFEKFACFHLFNVKLLSGLHIEPPYEGWLFKEFAPNEVPQLLGETSLQSFVSPPSTGTWFLICKDTDGFDVEQMYPWLARRWKETQPFRQALQYAVDGVSDIDYVAPHFSPGWVNAVQKGGMYFLGSPRQDIVPPRLCPKLGPNEQQRINRMWRAYSRHQIRIQDTGSTLRKAVRIAGQFFEDYHRKAKRAEQLADLIIALEALFTPDGKTELTHRISQSCALLSCELGDGAGRQDTFKFLRSMFERRGKLFHGQYDSETEPPERLASDDEIGRLASLVRQSILRLLAIYLRGEDSLKPLRGQIQSAALDKDILADLLNKGDIETLIADAPTVLPSPEQQHPQTSPLDARPAPSPTPEP
ncbi:MAG: hypothetical protein K2Q17_15080 [Nitrospiraceae bacterium]|jgi:hypothetical protein|uniref:HEPN domain-containing protein n=1 Tax=Nitrospira cf. moscoviensis SBR1015 TaxID=96242 RepID=UPI000A0DEE16|nr:HEPN domain-containing protein [Nitrospira cf. moscoviensis SBR1015]MBY0248984.1 hypothetical protein [Nitrospiraceae bacterium]OQW36897.1 MAG: hypothetical protein A4E20_18025 [Nitrospira sp. SG-bin2]